MSSSCGDESQPLVIKLREDVICTICLSLPRVTMYQCKNGHLICKNCLPISQDECSTCKVPLGKIRSIIADKVLSLMPLPCLHAELGCQQELYHNRLEAHEVACPFRPVCCVSLACEAKVAICRMLDHISAEHKNFIHAQGGQHRVRKMNEFIIKDETFSQEFASTWAPTHLNLDNCHFFLQCRRSEDGNWYMWVCLLGTVDEAKKYKTCFKIFLPLMEEELIYKGPVNALTSDERYLPPKDDLFYLTFPDSVAKKFYQNGQISFEVAVFEKSDTSASDAPDSSSTQ